MLDRERLNEDHDRPARAEAIRGDETGPVAAGLPQPGEGGTLAPEAARRGASASAAEAPLPAGWVMQRTAAGRAFYIDHNTRRTQWTDPRLEAVPPSSVASPGSPLPELQAPWEQRFTPEGRSFFVNHDTRVTTWNDPRTGIKSAKPTKSTGNVVPYSRNFAAKRVAFRARLNPPKREGGRRCHVPVRRADIFEDSFRIIMDKTPEDLKLQLNVDFQVCLGEEKCVGGGACFMRAGTHAALILIPSYCPYVFAFCRARRGWITADLPASGSTS